MKQFTLDEYLKNPQKKVITREGLSARIICTGRKGYNTKPIIALVTIPNGTEVLKSYWEDGVNTRGCEGNPDDLFFVPEKKEGWISLYKINSVIVPGVQVYNTEEEAKLAIGSDLVKYISTIKIEWEE
ncbi:MAG: hypothetical protein UHU19_11670 [Lachnospiraceae bacterium]|nr:hypothetical protein [Lachnospiraceae bacterium]